MHICDFSIDATDVECLAKYINDSPKRYANCIAKPTLIDGGPHVLLFAKKDIKMGTELRYDYGGASKPWRKVCIFNVLQAICSS